MVLMLSNLKIYFLTKKSNVTESTDISIIKNDILPIYRQVVMGLSENQDLKPFATKVGLVLRSCGMDIKWFKVTSVIKTPSKILGVFF